MYRMNLNYRVFPLLLDGLYIEGLKVYICLYKILLYIALNIVSLWPI